MRYIDINSLENLDELQRQLDECKDWNCVKDILSNLSQKTCWYCEHYVPCTGYAEVDHWRPKCQKKYPWLEFVIKNYIYSCKACNNKKSTHFPLTNDSQRAKCSTDDLSKEEPLLLNPCSKEDVCSVCYDAAGSLYARTEEIIEKVKKTKHFLKLDTTERIAKKQKAFNMLDSDLEMISLFKTKPEILDPLIEKINKRLVYEVGNEFVWSFCMYIESWLRENEENFTEISIRDKIKFPQDFSEIYLGIA